MLSSQQSRDTRNARTHRHDQSGAKSDYEKINKFEYNEALAGRPQKHLHEEVC